MDRNWPNPPKPRLSFFLTLSLSILKLPIIQLFPLILPFLFIDFFRFLISINNQLLSFFISSSLFPPLVNSLIKLNAIFTRVSRFSQTRNSFINKNNDILPLNKNLQIFKNRPPLNSESLLKSSSSKWNISFSQKRRLNFHISSFVRSDAAFRKRRCQCVGRVFWGCFNAWNT